MALFNSAHGGNIREAATVLGISPDQLLDFSANINPLGMPVSVKRALIDNLDCIERYPDADYFHLHQRWRVITSAGIVDTGGKWRDGVNLYRGERS